MNQEIKRSAGILLPVSSLPSRYGIGCFSSEAYRFVDWLARAGQTYWQILPLGMTGYGDSPYQSFSAFAGNPYFIDLDGLIADGYLMQEECDRSELESQDASRVDYGRQYQARYPLLRRAYERYRQGAPRADASIFEEENRAWLEDFAFFMALKEHLKGAPLREWTQELRLRDRESLERLRHGLSHEIGFHRFLQERFYTEWMRLKRYANQKGIRIIGDLPIYVSSDSADLWCHPELFCLDGQGTPTLVAGCPPDGFSPEGQLWGNPLYRWEAHAQSGYRWWIERMRHAFSLYDAVRIDHFRGFDAYYAIRAEARTAQSGRWEDGPGSALLEAIRGTLGERDGIAEDLGFITESVRELVRRSGFASMKVLQLAFDETENGFESEHFPHRYPVRCVAYTGTHDNPTLTEWLRCLSARDEARLRAYLCDFYTPREALREPIIALLMRSAAERCVIPLQDYLAMGGEGRLNRPSVGEGNWQWRVRSEDLTEALCQRVRRMTELGGRIVDESKR